MLVPQAMPLAILLSSLITFGNLGESSELTAIKAAGISLMQAFRSLIAISVAICVLSIYFQNSIGPEANRKLALMLISMKQKSPELEIPEGVFYDGIPNSNLYVSKKNMDTGKLYGIMIYLHDWVVRRPGDNTRRLGHVAVDSREETPATHAVEW